MSDIGWAREELVSGKRVRRAGWNGKGMWLELVPPSRCRIAVYNPDQISPLPWIGMNTAQGEFVPWLCSQTDFLAADWENVE